MASWRVDYRDVTKDKHLGTVEAPDENGAIAEAMKAFSSGLSMLRNEWKL